MLKKMIISMVVGMMIMGCVGFVGLHMVTKSYENKLAETKKEYEHQISELENNYYWLNEKYTKLNDQHSELEKQVWNLKNGKPYDIKINHGKKLYTYESKNKLFSSETRINGEEILSMNTK